MPQLCTTIASQATAKRRIQRDPKFIHALEAVEFLWSTVRVQETVKAIEIDCRETCSMSLAWDVGIAMDGGCDTHRSTNFLLNAEPRH